MWSYYGSKSKIVDLYPPPKFDRIIEPFAGSARYSLKYWQKDVLLMDKDEIIVRLWKWLQQCSKADIMKLPEPKLGDKIDRKDFDCIEAAWLMGFIIQNGVNAPRLSVSKYAVKHGIDIKKKGIADKLHKIKHWTIQLGTYDEIPNFEATWFIDPPYQFGGEYYRYSNKALDFEHLGRWCQGRNGQVIVCENTKADWLDFKPMKRIQGSAQTGTTEAIWSNHITNYDNEQGLLF